MNLRKNFLVLILAFCLLVGGGVFAQENRNYTCQNGQTVTVDPAKPFKSCEGTTIKVNTKSVCHNQNQSLTDQILEHPYTCQWYNNMSSNDKLDGVPIGYYSISNGARSKLDVCGKCYQNAPILQVNFDCYVEGESDYSADGLLFRCHRCVPIPGCDDGSAGAGNAAAAKDECPDLKGLAESKKKNLVGVCVCAPGFKQVGDECKPCNAEGVCCGISLNTQVPFVGSCVEYNPDHVGGRGESASVNETTVFPVLMSAFTKILVTVILLMSFLAILAGGVMITASGGSDTGASKGKKLIGSVIIALALLGSSGIILRLINPNFFN